MKTATLIVPWTDDTGHTYGSGEEVDLSDEEYAAMRLDGKVASLDQPYAGEPGHYGDVTTRSDVQGTPKPADADDAPKARKR